MSDEEFDNVAGGTYGETADDSVFLSFHGLCKKYSEASIMFDSSTSKEEDVKAGWAKVGVQLEYHGNFENFYKTYNKYFINGVEVSRSKAYIHALNILSKQNIKG